MHGMCSYLAACRHMAAGIGRCLLCLLCGASLLYIASGRNCYQGC